MEDKRKIKELYNCEYIVSGEELYPLQKWYNQLINKTNNEITVADVLRMIRQKVFVELAISKAMEFLKDNVFAGEVYDGEMLEKISEIDASFLKYHSHELKSILIDAMNKSETHDWSYEGEGEEFKTIIESLSKKTM